MDEHGAKLLAEWNERMERETRVPLWEPGTVPDFRPEYGQREPSVVVFPPKPGTVAEGRTPGAGLVCAGGGFSIKAPHEGWPVCEWLNENGIAAFLLDYRLNPYLLPTIIGDAKRAMRLIRHRADAYGIDPHKIGILGFSAGGQITATVSTLFDEGAPEASDPVERISCKPDVQVPCYPVTSLIRQDKASEPADENDADGWTRWMRAMLGADADVAQARAWSPDCNVRSDTPPAFLWGTCDDFLQAFWPPYLAALKEKGVSYESHIFSNGPHGMGLAAEHPTARAWPSLAAAWLKLQGF